MNGELLSIIDTIVRDKGIDREALIQAIEAALASAAKKGVGKETKEVAVTIDRKRGTLSVVSDGQPVSSAEFSRIGAQTAKQVIMQKIREAERDVIIGEFQDKTGTIVSGTVHRFERGDIIVDLGRAEGILPKAERIPYEDYKQGDRVQAYVLEVRKGMKGAEIVLSRANEGFIRGLFALEVPEIADGTVEIKALAREPGDRTKLAVFSTDEKVDSQGACIGMRGTRVKNIVRELHGERVDIIRWHENINEYLAAALAPAAIAEIQADPTTRQALVIVNDDQLSLAIGKKGQNVRLASKLTGWQLEIKSRSQLTATSLALRDVRGIGPTMEERLAAGGVTNVEQLASITVEQLSAIKGIGEKTAQKLIEAAKQALTAGSPSSPSEPSSSEPASDSEPAPDGPTQAEPPAGKSGSVS
ncbi:MAG: transcription termination/antitermination protein NusA [Candidatus Omnitrophica bacterium]|nr:transcription termination/antitermination protein NusA [Candidatus Omnitrophota bacterium]